MRVTETKRKLPVYSNDIRLLHLWRILNFCFVKLRLLMKEAVTAHSLLLIDRDHRRQRYLLLLLLWRRVLEIVKFGKFKVGTQEVGL